MKIGEIAYYTFRCTGISFLCIVSVIAMIQGCKPPDDGPRPVPPPPPKPTIKVEQSETDTQNSLSVHYLHHNQEINHQSGFVGNPYVQLNNIEEVLAYKKQAEFLLKALDEAERKMTIHEDGPKATSP